MIVKQCLAGKVEIGVKSNSFNIRLKLYDDYKTMFKIGMFYHFIIFYSSLSLNSILFYSITSFYSILSQVVDTRVLIRYAVNVLKSWVKVFMIIPEFRILRLTFHTERQPQNAELGRLFKSFSDLLSDCLRTFDL